MLVDLLQTNGEPIAVNPVDVSTVTPEEWESTSLVQLRDGRQLRIRLSFPALLERLDDGLAPRQPVGMVADTECNLLYVVCADGSHWVRDVGRSGEWFERTPVPGSPAAVAKSLAALAKAEGAESRG